MKAKTEPAKKNTGRVPEKTRKQSSNPDSQHFSDDEGIIDQALKNKKNNTRLFPRSSSPAK